MGNVREYLLAGAFTIVFGSERPIELIESPLKLFDVHVVFTARFANTGLDVLEGFAGVLALLDQSERFVLDFREDVEQLFRLSEVKRIILDQGRGSRVISSRTVPHRIP